MLHRDINLLQPQFKQQVQAILTRLDQLGIKYIISETLRDIEVQKAYYAQGSEPLATVNRLRKIAGLWNITEEENKKKITWTMKSKHLEGLAIDIVPMKDGTFWWTAPHEKWEEIGKIAEEFGLAWGGRWKSKDCPHIESMIKYHK